MQKSSPSCSPKPVVIIPLRSGSKGLPGKNTRSLAGIPLYMHSVKCATALGIDDIIIATDILEVLSTKNKGFTPFHRSAQSAHDDAPTHEVLLEVIHDLGLEHRLIVLLQATSPCRTADTIKKTINLFSKGMFDLCCSVTEVDNSLLKAGMIEQNSFKPCFSTSALFMPRQRLPKTFKIDGSVYVFNASWLLANGSLHSENIGVTISSPEESIDIDSLDDFNNAELILQSRCSL